MSKQVKDKQKKAKRHQISKQQQQQQKKQFIESKTSFNFSLISVTEALLYSCMYPYSIMLWIVTSEYLHAIIFPLIDERCWTIDQHSVLMNITENITSEQAFPFFPRARKAARQRVRRRIVSSAHRPALPAIFAVKKRNEGRNAWSLVTNTFNLF